MPEEPKTAPMRVSLEAMAQARIAAAFRGVSMVQYVSDVVLAAAAHDIEVFRRGGNPSAVKPRRTKSD